jgi:hypothetical protein
MFFLIEVITKPGAIARPFDTGLVSKYGAEIPEVDLVLMALGRLEADLERGRGDRPDLAQKVSHRDVAAW